jgi:predicted nucleotidyltransferase component of viral defense system
MPLADLYKNQVRLLIRTIPVVATEECFALKGGTAINLFVRDMPRLSVDIDLVYLPIKDRDDSLNEIDAALKRIAESLRRDGLRVQASTPKGETRFTKLNVSADNAIIKIEVTPVLRGCVYEPVSRTVSEKVELEFGFAEMAVVSLPDLYAGKIMAALDRQHPRDLFDVKDLLANEGISPELRKAFVVYLVESEPHHGVTLPQKACASKRAALYKTNIFQFDNWRTRQDSNL